MTILFPVVIEIPLTTYFVLNDNDIVSTAVSTYVLFIGNVD